MNDIFTENLTRMEIKFSSSSSTPNTRRYILPKNLKELSIISTHFDSIQNFGQFVQTFTERSCSIHHLQTLNIVFSLHENDETQFRLLIETARSLTHLSVIARIRQSQERTALIYNLPSSLVKIRIKSSDGNLIRDFLASLSQEKTPNLKNLHLSAPSVFTQIPLETQFPSSLLSLDLGEISIETNQLPPSLTALRAHLKNFNYDNPDYLDLLPKSLKIFDPLDQHGLTDEWWLSDIKQFISHLPPKLAVLDAGAELEEMLASLANL
jgi:hypothetical protein